MSEKGKIPSTIEAWESGELGADEKHARVAPKELTTDIEDSLGLQMISIRLDKELIETFKLLAQFHGVGYQPLMRDALKRFANSETKSIVRGVVHGQQQKPEKTKKHLDHPSQKQAA